MGTGDAHRRPGGDARARRAIPGDSAGDLDARLRWAGDAPDGVADAAWCAALQALEVAFTNGVDGLATVSEIAPDFVRLHERAATLAERASSFLREPREGSVRWVDVTATQL